MPAAKTKSSAQPPSLEDFTSCPQAILIIGADRVRTSRLLEDFAKKFFGADWRSILQRIEAEHLPQISDQLQSLSLFSKQQLFLIEQVQELSEKRQKELHNLAELVAPGSCLVLSAGKLNASSALRKHFQSKKLLFELPDLEGAQLKRWTENELKLQGIKRFSPYVVDGLISLAHSELDQLNKLITQLALYIEGDNAQDQDLKALFTQQLEPSEFELINTVLGKNRATPEILLSQLLSSGKNAFALLGLIARVFSNYLRIKLMLASGEKPQAISASLGQSAWVFGKSMQAAQQYSLKQLRAIQLAVVRADTRLKNRSLGPDLVLSDLVQELVPR